MKKALVVAVCIYGLSKSNHIFIGVADTECSILKFIDEVLDGESKETKPKLANTTRNNYLHRIEKNIKPNEFGLMKICNVRKSDVKKFYSYLYLVQSFYSS